jgi:hypothetical protein
MRFLREFETKHRDTRAQGITEEISETLTYLPLAKNPFSTRLYVYANLS